MKKLKNKIKLNKSDLNSLTSFPISSYMDAISYLYLIDLKKKKHIPLTKNEKFIDDYCFIDFDFIKSFVSRL